MVSTARFTLSLATLFVIASAAPSIKSGLSDLTGLVKEYHELYERMYQEKTELQQFARAGHQFMYRWINGDILKDIAIAHDEIQRKANETDEVIAEKLLAGGDEKCLLTQRSRLQEEQRAFGDGISECAANVSETKDSVGDTFQENLDILQRLTTSISEYMLWSFSMHNSVTQPERHVDTMLRAYYELELLWRESVLPTMQDNIDGMHAQGQDIVASHSNCLDGLIEKTDEHIERIRDDISLCPVPYKA
ncbi:uncharacterized protein LOC129779544 isoform X1 [Toxorhynchites rutilus septentrionalis]|uniref:uncharacterized protein LOC129779544 isoform X1 n=1 Tax=Toxorhynchites rutilus septentrionalis TaxID=329112 RepID=UPI00247992AB|nr:uncharacterized protein LOC129779544 isoform X1 [Toxorhynchites rutilus septentrionalis]